MAEAGAAAAEPQDAIMMRELLDSMGVDEYEPRVVHQLLDFMYGYVSGVLQDAEAYGERAGQLKGTVEVEEVLTAIQARAALSFVQPPSQDILTSLAARRNAQPLPPIGKAHGLRLPPEDACLTAPMWELPPPVVSPQPSSGPVGTPGGAQNGPAAMDVDNRDGAYPLPQRQVAAGGRPAGGGRPQLDVNPGQAPDD